MSVTTPLAGWRRLGGLLLMASLTAGFSSASSFELDAALGGGGGYAFTGSPSSHGRSCAVCHEPAGGVDYTITSPSSLFDAGYIGGRDYVIEITMNNERFGLEQQGGCQAHSAEASEAAGCNRNVFVAEILSASGAPLGELCHTGRLPDDVVCPSQSGDGTTLINGGAAIVGQSLATPTVCGPDNPPGSGCVDVAAARRAGATDEQLADLLLSAIEGQTTWRFAWRAPAGAVGAQASLHIGIVDGNGGRGYDPAYADYAGDGVAVGSYVIPAAHPVSSEPEQAGACRAATTDAPIAPMLLILLLLGAALRPLRRRQEETRR